MPNQGTNFGERYLSGSNLVALYGDRVKLPAVNKWVESGKVKTDADGRRCEQDVLITLLDAKIAEAERMRTLKYEGDVKEELERAKLRKLLLEGDLIEIEKEGKLGDLIRADEAIAELNDVFAKVKAKLLTIPNRMALEIAGLDDPKEIQDRLEEVCREALDELNHSLMGTDETEEPD